MPRVSDHRTGFLLALLAALAFAVLPIFGKQAFAEGVRVVPLLAWRFAIATVLLWALVLARREGVGTIPPGRRIRLLALGALYSVNSVLYFFALERIPAAATSLIFYVYPALVAVLGAAFLRHRLHAAGLGALGLALAGVALTVGFARVTPDSLGVALALLSAVVVSGYFVFGELALAGLPTLPATAFVVSGSGAAFWLWQLLGSQPGVPPTGRAWLLVLVMGTVCTAFSIVAMLGAIRRIGARPTAILSTLEPAFTAALAAWLLGETLAPRQLLGGVLILSGVALVPVAELRRARELADV